MEGLLLNALEKKVVLTVRGLKTKLDSPLNFYVNDKVRLAITIKEFDYELVSGYSRSKKLKTVTPLEGTLSIDTPFGIDSIEHVDIIDEVIYFELDNKYTGCAGTYNAQLFLKSVDEYQKAIPPFSFTVNNTINEELDGNTRKDVSILLNNKGECLLGSNNEIIIFK